MIRYTLFVLTILGSAATALATVTPANSVAISKANNISIFYKTDIGPVLAPLVVEQCAKEDCSDTPSNS